MTSDLINIKAFGQRLKEGRDRLDISQTEFAMQAGIGGGQSKMKRFESGEQLPKSRKEAQKIAAVLNVDWRWLVFGPEIVKGDNKFQGGDKKVEDELRSKIKELEIELKTLYKAMELNRPVIQQQYPLPDLSEKAG